MNDSLACLFANADYDNACLYNDYVVFSLMQQYQDEDAVVLYFPDHGLDVFQSSPKYYGHTRGLDKKSKRIGFEVPMIVYMTQQYRDLHPEGMHRITELSAHKYNTADNPFTVLNLAGFAMLGN